MRGTREVVVVGGGPAGLYAAHLLAAQGFDVLVLDRRQAIGEDVVCTGIVSKEAFDRFGFSPRSILSEIQRLRLVSAAGSVLDYTHPGVLAYAVDRHRFDDEIQQWAGQSGAQIRLECTVRRIRGEREHLELWVESPGRCYEVRAAVVIISTGVRYYLHRQLGLGIPAHYLRAAQTHLPMNGSGPTTVYVGQAIAPGGFAWVVPLRKNLCRVGLMTEGNARQQFQRLLERLGWADTDNGRVDLKPIAQGLASKASGDRVVAVGEAAGQVKTTTGGGIYYGLLGAEIAAEVVGQALRRSDVSAQSLEEYGRRCQQLMGREIKLGYWLRGAASRLSDSEIERILQALQQDGFLAFIEKRARFDWHREVISYLLRMPVVRSLLCRVAGA